MVDPIDFESEFVALLVSIIFLIQRLVWTCIFKSLLLEILSFTEGEL